MSESLQLFESPWPSVEPQIDVIDSSNRPSDPARIKSTSDKEYQREKRDSSFLTIRPVYGVSVRIQSRGQLAKYLFARSTFEINSHGCLSVSV